MVQHNIIILCKNKIIFSIFLCLVYHSLSNITSPVLNLQFYLIFASWLFRFFNYLCCFRKILNLQLIKLIVKILLDFKNKQAKKRSVPNNKYKLRDDQSINVISSYKFILFRMQKMTVPSKYTYLCSIKNYISNKYLGKIRNTHIYLYERHAFIVLASSILCTSFILAFSQQLSPTQV